MDKNIGKRLDGRYEITELIGIGGMADVYKAHDIVEDRDVAVKILKTEFADNDEFVRRFRNESKAIAVLSHPNIVKIYDVSFSDKMQYIVMEYIDGITLKEFIEQQGVLRWKDTVHFIIQILRALQHAHDRGIVHRDIKPQNIMLFPDGTIKVMDFGIARFAREEGKTISDKAIGSVHYISPEQARGDITDEKSDIYSVGVMMYEMLTGIKPFDGDNPVAIALMHMQEDPKPPRQINDTIPEGLEEIVMRAMQRDASRRYQSASEMIKDIEEFKKNPSIVFEYTYLTPETEKYYNPEEVKHEPQHASKKLPIFGGRSGNSEAKAMEKENKKNAESEEQVKTYTPKKKVQAVPVPEPPTYEEDDDGDDDHEASGGSVFIVALTAVAAGVLIVVTIFIAVIVFKNISTGKSETYPMPKITGYNYQMVADTYADFFKLQVEVEEYNDAPEGTIISQSPDEGRDIIKGKTTVLVRLSKGPKQVQIPNVFEIESDTAQSMLERLNLKVTPVVVVDEQEENTVIRTEPEIGSMVKEGTEVKMYVSKGPEITNSIVPNVVGMKLAEAQDKLTENNILNVKIEKVESAEPEDKVLSQSVPQKDAEGNQNVITPNQEFVITVSTGVAPQADAKLTFSIPSGLKGKATFKAYINGNVCGEASVDNIAYVSSVAIDIRGSETQKVFVEAINSDGESGSFAEFSVDFTPEEGAAVTAVSQDNAMLDKLFGVPVETTVSETEPVYIPPYGNDETTSYFDYPFTTANDEYTTSDSYHYEETLPPYMWQ